MIVGDYAAIQDYLFSLKAGGPRFGLDRMAALAEELGHPERAVPVIHVAGTNGKGSTAAMIESILRAAGWKTGLYTSPHLIRLGERVQVNRAILTEQEIVAYVQELRPVAEKVADDDPHNRPSFFEFMTAMAFLQFQRKRCDIAVVEVGMGGRLDATNIVTPLVSVITSIGLDHCEELGDTVGKIAAEKAGIVKPGKPVVIGRMPREAESVIRAIATERGCPVISVGAEISTRNLPVTSLPGEYQRWNAATAALTIRQLESKRRINQASIDSGLGAVSWPGRWQTVKAGERTIIVDASHNPEGAGVLDENLTALRRRTGRKPQVVVGVLGTFRARAILDVVARHAAEAFFVVPNQARASGFDELEALLSPGLPHRRSTVKELFPEPGRCTVGVPGDTVVVTGSIYLAGEVLDRLEPADGVQFRLQDF